MPSEETTYQGSGGPGSGGPGSGGPGSGGPGSGGPGQPERGWAWRWGRAGLRFLVAFVIAVAIAIGLLHIPSVQLTVLNNTLERVLPEDFIVTLGGSTGSPLGGLTFTDVRVSTPGDTTWAAVDTLRFRYDVRSLIGILHIREVSMGHLSFQLGRRADSSFVLPTFPESDSTTFAFDLDQVAAEHLSGTIVQNSATQRSTVLWTVSDGQLDLPSLSNRNEGVAASLRSLELAFSYPDVAESGQVAVRAELGRDGVFSADLRGSAPESELDVALSGHFARSSTDGVAEGDEVDGAAEADARGLALDVEAAGHLGFDDLRPFMATLRENGRLEVDLTAHVSPDSVRARAMLDGGAAGRADVWVEDIPSAATTGATPVAPPSDPFALPRNLSLVVSLADIRPDMLATDLPEQTRLNARAEATLALGDEWSETMGRVDVTFQPGTVLGRRIGAGSAYAERAGSTISWNGTVRAAGALLSSNGNWETDSDRLAGTVSVDGLTPQGMGITSSVPFTAGIRANVSGTTSDLSATAELVNTTVGACSVSSQNLRLQMDGTESPAAASVGGASTGGTTVRVQGALTACAEPLANLDVRAAITASDTRIWGRVRTGRAPLHHLLALADTTYLPGETSFDMTVDGPVSANGRYTDVQAGGAVLDTLNVQASGTMNALTFTANADRLDGTVRTRVRWVAVDNRLDLTSLDLQNLDVASVLQIPDQSLILSGSGTGTLDWPNGRFDLALGGSRINEVDFSLLNVDLRLSADSIKADVRAQGEGVHAGTTADFMAGFYPTQDSLITAKGTFAGLDVGSLLALEGQSSDLNGNLDVRGRLQNGIPELEGNVSFAPGSLLNDFRVANAELNLRLEDGVSSGKLVLQDENGGITGSFGQNNGRMFVNLKARDLDVTALTRLMMGTTAEPGATRPDSSLSSAFSATMEANVQLSDGEWTEVVATGDSLSGTWGGIEVDHGYFGIRLDRSSLHVDSLFITGTDLRLDGEGSFLQESSDFTLRANLPPALMQLPAVQETGIAFTHVDATIRVSGPLEQRRVVADLTVGGLRNESYYASEVTGRLLAQYGEGANAQEPDLRPLFPSLLPADAELTLNSSVVDVPGLSIQSSSVRVAWDGIDVTADADLQLTDTQSIGLSGILTTDAEPLVLTVDRMTANLDDQTWELAAPTRLTFGPTLSLSPFRLVADDDQWIGATTISRNGVETHVVTLQRMQLGPLANLIGFPGLGGWASGEFTFSSPGDTLAFQGSLDGELQAFGENVGSATARMTRKDSDLVMDVVLTHPEGGELTAVGRLPLGTPDGTVDFQLNAEAYPIGWTRVFIDPLLIDDLRGFVSGGMHITGEADNPAWTGNMELREGRIGLTVLGKRRGLRYEDVEADLSFRADSVLVDRLEATSGSGTMRATGGIAMTDLQLGSVDIAFNAEDFLAVDNSDYRTVISGNGRLTGTTDRPLLGGDIDVVSADFYLSDEVSSGAYEAVTLTDADLLTLRERFGMRISAEDTTAFDFYRVLAIEDLTIRMQRDTWVRSESNPEMDIQINGRLDVDKDRNADPTVFGNIEVLPERSQINQFGRRFSIDRGTLTFNGPIGSPRMDLQASYDVPSRSAGGSEVIIRLNVTGTPEDLEVTFDSDPAMELADIVSYIATGRPASSSFQLGSQTDNYLQSAAGLAMGPLTDLVENMAGSGLGLDVIEIAHVGTQGLTLTAGKYVSPKLYVSVSQPISLSSSTESSATGGESATQVAVEYEIIRQLLITLINRGTVLRVNLRWEYAF